MVVPARQAYSHWASVGRTYFQPAGNRPAVCSISFNRDKNTCTSFQETCSTGLSLLLGHALGLAFLSLRIASHHGLVLSLGHLILTQVKPIGQGDLMLNLVSATTRLRGRTAHCKSAWGTEDHFHPISRWHGVAGRGAVHHKRSGMGGDRSKIIAYHEGIISVVLGLFYIFDHITITRRPCDGLTILVPLIGQILPLGLR